MTAWTAQALPPELVAILDEQAGRAHSPHGAVRRCLADILNAYDQLREQPDPLNLPTYQWGESVTWSDGRVLVPLNLEDVTFADLELDENSAGVLAAMLTDAAGRHA